MLFIFLLIIYLLIIILIKKNHENEFQNSILHETNFVRDKK